MTTQRGTIKGDFGGIYSFTWETAVQRQGRTLYLKGRRTAFSPNNFRDFVQYSWTARGSSRSASRNTASRRGVDRCQTRCAAVANQTPGFEFMA